MRYLLVLALALTGSACNLYFSDDGESPPDTDLPDSGPHPPPATTTFARCEDGTLRRIEVGEYASDHSGHGAGTVIGHCEGACNSAVVACPAGDCGDVAGVLCGHEPAPGFSCELAGLACTGDGPIECPGSTTCGFSVPGATCTCTDGVYVCAPRTDTAGVHARMVGKWRGTVMPPSFTKPYEVSLWIYPDGTYWAEAPAIAFYYGGDGPHPDRKISVLSTSPEVGAWADIGIYFGGVSPNIGALSSLVVDATHLSFTYYASWHGCAQPFFFTLAREPG